jgi:aminoglycoside 3'-phosphotransferase-2
MNTPTEVPAWAWTWASQRLQARISAATRVESSVANQVLRLECGASRCFLKIGPRLQNEHDRLLWLEGRLPCPRPLGFIVHGEADALLTSAVEGDGLASLSITLPAQTIIVRLAAALKAVHAVDTADWPFGGEGSVLVHGDACLPNFLYSGDHLSGCIDVGDMTVGEAEIDLAAAVWSLQYNMGAGHGLVFLKEYGMTGADEDDVERLRLRYERG